MFIKNDLTNLPLPELGYITIGLDLDGELKYINELGVITPIGGVDGVDGVDGADGADGINKLDELLDTNINLPAITTSDDDGKILFYDHNTSKWITKDTVTHGNIVINGKKSTVGTIDKGKPVYLVGSDNDVITVEEANAGSINMMPVVGFTAESTDNTSSKHIITFGKLTGIDTSLFSIGDILYIDNTTGGLTTTRPIGSGSKIQRVAKILKSDPVNGQLFVFNTARTSGLPNLGSNKIWVGDANGIPQEIDKNDVYPSWSKTFTIESPSSFENITVFRTDLDITIQEVIAVSTGTSPDTTYQLKHSNVGRDQIGNNLTTSSNTTSTSIGDTATLDVNSVPANSWIWFETTSANGMDVTLTIDIRYTRD